jgi:hypothetical protein
LCCYNKTPALRNLFLTVVEAGKSKIKAPMGSLSAEGLVNFLDGTLNAASFKRNKYHVLTWGKEKRVNWPS